MKIAVPLISVVVVIVAVLSHEMSLFSANLNRSGEGDELQYPVDPTALRSEFRQTGSFPLRVPGLGEVRITGTGGDPTCDPGRCTETDYLQVVGSLIGYTNSTANILLGEYGVYGSATIPVPGSDEEVRYEFDAVEAGDGYELWVHLAYGSASPSRLSRT